jgi:hypothetical protein
VVGKNVDLNRAAAAVPHDADGQHAAEPTEFFLELFEFKGSVASGFLG